MENWFTCIFSFLLVFITYIVWIITRSNWKIHKMKCFPNIIYKIRSIITYEVYTVCAEDSQSMIV